MKKIAVGGSSGLVGQALCSALKKEGHQVFTLVRPETDVPGGSGFETISWEPGAGQLEPNALEGLDAVVHLGGANIADGRWTDSRKALIRESRVASTKLLSETMAECERPPSCFVCASAVGFYGDCGDAEVAEDHPMGEGFLAEVAQDWEAACLAAKDAGIRVVHARLAMVLAKDGGALAKLLPPFKLGVGGTLGDGGQYMGWVTLEDAIRALTFCIITGNLAGPVNICAPDPVTNKAFTKALGHQLGRPTILPMPKPAVRLLMGEMADEMLFASCRAIPAVLLREGFEFTHPSLEKAFASLLGR